MASTTREIIYRGESIISVEKLPDYPDPVVVKRPAGRDAPGAMVRSLENEYEMTRSLDAVEGVRKVPRQQPIIENQPALVLEYVDGETLGDVIARNALDLRSKLEIAVELARILGELHRLGVLHLDLSSENILINNQTRVVHLIDLGAAARIDGTGHQRFWPVLAHKSLPYISPEQTGRINRAVDERSDLYSFGVVLYELMTAQPPFRSVNPMELIHHHIARTPTSPSEVSSETPEIISTIILKLLRKNADDRYQSAKGIQSDLEECLQRLRSDNVIDGFPIAEADVFSRLRFPQSLYGRDGETRELVGALDRACRDTSEIIFVSGYSGVGKTALAEELQRPVVERRGCFAKGKFEQYLKTTPYSAITQAFSAFVSQILTEPEMNFIQWRDTIQSSLGDLGRVMTDVVPALEDLVGSQPGVPRVGGQEAENRFHLVFINFLKAVATEEQPLVLFIDDLQWIDAASLRLLEVIRSEFDQPGLLVIGAYRDNEVDARHPLMAFVGDQEEKRVPLRELRLDGLTQHHLESFVSDTLRLRDGAEALGSAIYERTQGNPFFFRRLLSSLDEEGRIRFDPDSGEWTWSAADIDSEAIADNVADLLAKTIAQLPEETRDILKLAACIGNRIEIPTLAMISGRTEDEVADLLTSSSGGQYVIKTNGFVEFVHDQVQKAAYTLIDQESRPAQHLEIARLFLADTDESELDERIFDIVTHYNLGANLLTDEAERLRVAELNLRAGRRSKMSSAFLASVDYLKQGLDLLGQDPWNDHYDLALQIHDELIDACYLTIRYDEVQILFDSIVEHSRHEVDSQTAYQTMIMAKVAANEPNEAIALADEYLDTLHISFDAGRTSDLSAAEFYALPPMEDRRMRAAMAILMAVASPIAFAAPDRLASLFHTMLNIMSRHGNSEISSFVVAWYAMLLCMGERHQEGNVFGQLAVDLLEKFPSPGISSKVMSVIHANIRPWESSVHDQIAPLKDSHLRGLQEGDFEWGLYCLTNYLMLLWGAGKPLSVFASESGPCIELCASKNQEIARLTCSLFAESVSNLMGESAHTTKLEGRWFSEKSMLPQLEGNDYILSFYRILKITLCYLFGDHHEAFRHVEVALKTSPAWLSPHYLHSKTSFYGGLACVATLADVEDEDGRRERLGRLEEFERELKLWAELAPMNYLHEYHLLRAETCRISGDHWQAVQNYERAVKGARENDFAHDEALAHELFGRFWLEQGNKDFAAVCISQARDRYRQWGATAKVEDLDTRYSEILSPKVAPSVSSTVEDIPLEGRRDFSKGLDLESVLKASQALSGELVLERLLAKMMDIVIENAGAERGVLLLHRDDDWFVEAEGHVERGGVSVEQSIALEDSQDVPASLIHYVERTGEIVILADAGQDGSFTRDAYVSSRHPKSVLAMPLLHRGELTGILYLENKQATGVFTHERVALLEMLSSEMAMALDNAQLYARLEERVAEKTADLVKSKQLLRALRKSEERYELAVAGSAAGIWDWDLRSDQVYYSVRLMELLGYAPGELSNSLDEFWSRLHPDDDVDVREALDQHLEKRVPFDVEYRLRIKSGEYRWFHARGQALWDETNEPTRISGSMTDITVRKHVEDGLRQSREFNRSVLMSLPENVAVLDREGTILTVNDSWIRFAQENDAKSPESLGPGVNYVEVCDRASETGDQSVGEALDGIRSVIDGSAAYFEMEYPCDSPSINRWFLMTVSPFRGLKGGVIVAHVDITSSKLAEDELQQSEMRFRGLMEQSPLAIAILTPDGQISQVNSAWMRMWGVDEEQAAEVLAEYNILRDRQAEEPGVGPLIRRAFAGEAVVLPPIKYSVDRTIEDIGLEHITGTTAWIQCHLAPVKDGNGEVLFVVNTYVDITKLRLAEDALAVSESNLLKAQEVGHIGSWQLDLLEDNLNWTDENYRIFGVPRGTPMTYESFLERVHPEDRDYVDREWNAAAQGKPYDIEHRLLVDDEVKWVREKAELTFDDQGNPTSGVGIALDITERKRSEGEARRHQEVLARLDRAMGMGHLTGSIAHELNQPLTGILSNAQATEMLIESGQWEDDDLKEIMAEIVADAKRAGEVIRNLRELYLEQKGELLPVDINSVVDDTAQLLKSEFVIQHVELTTEYASLVSSVNGNKIQIQQVLVNLVMNGIQAMHEMARRDRRLHISTAHDADEVKLWVEDRGHGIDPERIDGIFEPLATWRSGGMGMGLAISNSIIEAHGGRMSAENRPEGGARVGFTLPALTEAD